jgi:hypothetical protein
MEQQGSPTYAFISTTSTTYHPENPLENAIIDNPGLVRRRRRKTSARELEVLEMAFRENEKPSREAREDIARRIGMEGKAVQVLSSVPGLFAVSVLIIDLVPEQTTIITTFTET